MGKKDVSNAAATMGAAGGKARARNLSKKQLSAIGLAGAKARWGKKKKRT